jgi:hypothetical protein
MLPPGKYRTEAGSTMTISGKHGGISEVELDWLDEDGACIDCDVIAYDDQGYLTWTCDFHEPGRAKLERVK